MNDVPPADSRQKNVANMGREGGLMQIVNERVPPQYSWSSLRYTASSGLGSVCIRDSPHPSSKRLNCNKGDEFHIIVVGIRRRIA
jgi:hypothetical protein